MFALMSPEFLITSLIVVASPGTGVLYTLGAGLGRGARASVIAAFGCTLGILPHLLAAVLGLSAMMETSVLAFEILRVAGVAYLLYMAWMTLKETGALAVAPDGRDASALDITVRAILLNLLNPKLTVFFLAFLPQFVGHGEAQPTLRFVELGGVFMAMTFIGVRCLWRRRRQGPRSGDGSAVGARRAAPPVRRCLRAARPAVGAHRALMPQPRIKRVLR